MSRDVCVTRNSRTELRRKIYGPQPIWCRVYNPALGKWLAAIPAETPAGSAAEEAPYAGGVRLEWTHDPSQATVLESHEAEATAEALVGLSRRMRMGWEQVYAERCGNRLFGSVF